MQTAAAPAADGPPRVVGGWDLTWQAVNIMVGTSVLVLPGLTLDRLGGWAPIAVLVAAVGILFAFACANVCESFRDAARFG